MATHSVVSGGCCGGANADGHDDHAGGGDGHDEDAGEDLLRSIHIAEELLGLSDGETKAAAAMQQRGMWPSAAAAQRT